ncbi:MAG: sortase [Candidatus Saccharimonadales bacterium]
MASSINPLFPDGGDDQEKNSYILPNKQRRIEPLSARGGGRASAAAELIRKKIDTLYDHEPDIKEELAHPPKAAKPLSKHQQFMHDLSTSGKSLAQIQTDWHGYYSQLPDHEKHEVWQEFYQANERATSNYAKFIAGNAGAHPAARPPYPMPPHTEHADAKKEHAGTVVNIIAGQPVGHQLTPSAKRRTVASIKNHVLSKVRARSRAQSKAKKHLQSLVFGVGLGSLAVFIFLFGLFNERFIIPFIQPSGRAEATPIILSLDGIAPSSAPELIIPKINVQLPVVYDLPSSDEPTVQKGLEEGIIHYPNTAVPGQRGNAAYFGHSSNNIFNKGQYKFAFVLLHELVPGDIFYLTYNGKAYTYKVYEKRIVKPTDTWVLGPVAGKTATATLITCDPPGTSTNRLVVWGEQITPDPNANAAAPVPPETPPATEELPSDGPTLWTRFWRWITPW